MLFAVYGTLRKGDYNHGYYMRGLNPLSQERLEGFDMYSLGAYPYIKRGPGSITVEVYDVPKPQPMIDMEVSAGYRVTEVETTVGPAKIFYKTAQDHQRSQKLRPAPLVLSGDWFEVLRERNLFPMGTERTV